MRWPNPLQVEGGYCKIMRAIRAGRYDVAEAYVRDGMRGDWVEPWNNESARDMAKKLAQSDEGARGLVRAMAEMWDESNSQSL